MRSRLFLGIILAAALLASTACASRVSREEAIAAAQQAAGGQSVGGPSVNAGVGGGAAAPDTSASALPPAAVAPTAGPDLGTKLRGSAIPDASGKSDAVRENGAPQAAANRDPISIGMVATLSGIVGEAYANGYKVVRAWVTDVNSRGGAYGHPIKLFTADDSGTPSKNQALVQQMVEQNGVDAFVYNLSPFSGQASVAYIQNKKVPVVGGQAADKWLNENSMYFPQQSTAEFGARAFAYATAKQAKAQNKSKVALTYCIEAQSCKAAVAADAFKQAGLQVVQETGFSLAQPDFTSQCLAARNAGADVVFIAADSQSIIRFADNCTNIGYKPLYAWTAQGTTNSLLADKNLEGGVVGATAAPWFTTKLAAQREFQDFFAKYIPGTKPDGAAMTGWTTVKLFEKALAKMTGAPAPAAILKGLWSITKEDLGGLTYPMTFREGDPNNAVHQTTCFWSVIIRGGQWASPDDSVRTCL
jgi:branched-chain amino acid transport system substrate-binding protein